MTQNSIRLLRAGRRPTANASIFVGEYGSIFYAENTGTLRISDGVTPGGQPLQLVSSDFAFSFGDFVATTPSDGSASLSSKQTNQDINIYSNGTGSVHLIGNVAIYAPDGNIYARSPNFEVNNDGQVRILVSNNDPTAGALEIIGSTSGQLYPPVNAGVMLHITGQNSQASRLYNDGVGGPASFVGRRINNAIVSPQPVVAGEDIIRISSTGYNGTTVPGTASSRITFFATENWTTSNFGGNIAFSVTNNGSTTLTEVANVSYSAGITSTRFTGPLYGNVTTTGNIGAGSITVSGSYYGDGSKLSNMYGNTQVGAYLPTHTGNISANNITLTNNIIGNIGQFGNIIVTDNVIYSNVGSQDFNIGQLTATANININRTSVHKKDAYFVSNTFAQSYIVANSGIHNLGPNVSPTIDFASDSLVLVRNPGGTVTFSLTNYVAGKSVRALVSLNANRTINFGISSAQNSTTGATSVTFGGFGNPAAPETLALEYICVDGTAANTYVIANYV